MFVPPTFFAVAAARRSLFASFHTPGRTRTLRARLEKCSPWFGWQDAAQTGRRDVCPGF